MKKRVRKKCFIQFDYTEFYSVDYMNEHIIKKRITNIFSIESTPHRIRLWTFSLKKEK